MIDPEAAWGLLAEAMAQPRALVTVEQLRERLEARAMCSNVWLGERSAIYTQVQRYNDEIVFEAGPAGGELTEILAQVPRLTDVARDLGCTQAHIIAGRSGWARPLKSHGYEVYDMTLRKILR